MPLGLILETCEIILSYAIVYRRPPSYFYCVGYCALVLPFAMHSRIGHAYFMVALRGNASRYYLGQIFKPNNTSKHGFAGLLTKYLPHGNQIWISNSAGSHKISFYSVTMGPFQMKLGMYCRTLWSLLHELVKVLMASDVEGKDKISNIIDIFWTILNTQCTKNRCLCCLVKNQTKVELLSNIRMSSRRALKIF